MRLAALLFLTLALPVLAQREPEVDLTDFVKDADLWTKPQGDFMSTYRNAEFKWIEPNETARSAATNAAFARLKVWETLVYFRSNMTRQVVLSLYNRGDAGTMDRFAFNDLLAEVQTNLTALSGSAGATPQEVRGPANVSVMRRGWTKAECRLDLEWSFTPEKRQNGIIVPYRAEYIRLLLSPIKAGGAQMGPESGGPVHLSVIDLHARVKKESNGDTSLTGVPMVDQGEKGYCAAAVTERVLRYYGQDIDQHKVAQIADTTSANGTNPDDLVVALRRIAAKLDLNVKSLMEFNFKDFEKLVNDYNRVAEKEGKLTLQLSSVIVITDIYQEMDLDILRRVRARRAGDLARFQSGIQENINSGIPLLWSVVLGKVKEKPDLKMMGTAGHMRLIVGYNPKTAQVIYTDTWGAGHERKYMATEDAWAISTGLYTIKPWGVR